MGIDFWKITHVLFLFFLKLDVEMFFVYTILIEKAECEQKRG